MKQKETDHSPAVVQITLSSANQDSEVHDGYISPD
jgi:hypothetical protein